MSSRSDELGVEEGPVGASKLRDLGRRARAGKPGAGWPARARLFVWSAWLRVLVWAAEATWKRWLVVFVIALLVAVAFLFNPIEEEPAYGLNHEFSITSSEFLPSIAGATDTPFLEGNRIDVLNNGDEFYPAMLEAVHGAERTITVEAYIYWEGDIGRQFAEAFAEKARSGTTVKILLDAVGSSTISGDIVETLTGAGCEVQWYHPIHWYTIDRINNRTHRKSLIVDGRVGFTGGAGIADQWLGNAQDPEHWRDIQIRIEGPAVATLQSAFAQNWLETTGELVSGPEFYPPPESAGPLSVQSILSDPETGSSAVRILYYLSIVCARRSIFIANPYFVPDKNAIAALVEAERRGVDVKVMVAGPHNDNLLARDNSRRLYGPLIEGGVEIYEYDRTMLHQKYMVCDGIWSTVGTANFDSRSFALNDENNVCVYDAGFAALFERIFANDLASCHLVTRDEWKGRGALVKVRESLAAFVRRQV
jgi:cardiolipin synthase